MGSHLTFSSIDVAARLRMNAKPQSARMDGRRSNAHIMTDDDTMAITGGIGAKSLRNFVEVVRCSYIVDLRAFDCRLLLDRRPDDFPPLLVVFDPFRDLG